MPKRKLDPKRASNLEQILMLKLWACRELGKMLGWIGTTRKWDKRNYGPMETVKALVAVYFDDATSPISRAAAATLLDYHVPLWRKIIPIDCFGPVAERDDPAVYEWRRAVLSRDGECKQCGSREHLEAHHVIPWAQCPELRTDIGNGVALCKKCHLQVTVSSGR